MPLFEDDEDEESIPESAFEEGWNGTQPEKEGKDETEEAFEEYINNDGNNDDEPSYNDLAKAGQKIVDEEFEDDNEE